MGIEQRRHIRFSIDVPATRYRKYGESVETVITQISIGGCLAEWDDSVLIGDEFRMLVRLPNQNYLPLMCKALYKFADNGIGTKFLDITQFEQELLASVISNTLAEHGLPLQIDPFTQMRKSTTAQNPRISDSRREKDEILENLL